jgi:hypothetical protein
VNGNVCVGAGVELGNGVKGEVSVGRPLGVIVTSEQGLNGNGDAPTPLISKLANTIGLSASMVAFTESPVVEADGGTICATKSFSKPGNVSSTHRSAPKMLAVASKSTSPVVPDARLMVARISRGDTGLLWVKLARNRPESSVLSPTDGTHEPSMMFTS